MPSSGSTRSALIRATPSIDDRRTRRSTSAGHASGATARPRCIIRCWASDRATDGSRSATASTSAVVGTRPAPWPPCSAGIVRFSAPVDHRAVNASNGNVAWRSCSAAREPIPARTSVRSPSGAMTGSAGIGDRVAAEHRVGLAGAAGQLGEQAAAAQLGHHALAEPVGLLEVRVAGEDELVEAELVVLLRCGRRPRSWLPTSAVPAPPRTSPMPAHRFGAMTRSSRVPPCSETIRCWPTEALRAIARWAGSTTVGSSGVEEALGLQPGVGGPVPRDHVEADPEAQRAARARRPVARSRAMRGATIAGGSPHVR